jgi:hypothetical protein
MAIPASQVVSGSKTAFLLALSYFVTSAQMFVTSNYSRVTWQKRPVMEG